MKLFGVFDLGIKWDGYIASAGAIAYSEHHYIRKLCVPPTLVRHFLKVCKKYDLPVELIGLRTRSMSQKPNDVVYNYYKIFAETVSRVRTYNNGPVTSILLFSTKEYDERVKKECPGLDYFFRFCDYGVDVSNEIHEKGDAIFDVLNYLGYKKEEAIAFGDDYQDLTMADQVSKFICVGNGREEVKKKASMVCPAITEDGIEIALKELKLI